MKFVKLRPVGSVLNLVRKEITDVTKLSAPIKRICYKKMLFELRETNNICVVITICIAKIVII